MSEERIQISEDLWIQTKGISTFRIIMLDEDGEEQSIELLPNEIKAIMPHLNEYLQRCDEK